jgi:hypothetical protein
VFKAGASLGIALDGKLDSRDPVKTIELVVNGKVTPVALPHRFEMRESGWFLVRAIADVAQTFRYASTAPWYVEIGGRPAPPRREDAQFFLDWTRDRAASLEKALTIEAQRAEVVDEWRKAETFWKERVAAAGQP